MIQQLPKTRIARQLARINNISNNPPAALKLSKNLSSVNLTFKFKNNGGHMGIRKFWQLYLPTIKFYNPSLIVNVTRISLVEKDSKLDKASMYKIENDLKLIEKCPANLILNFNDGSSKTLDCKNKHSDDILNEFKSSVDHEPVSEEQTVKF